MRRAGFAVLAAALAASAAATVQAQNTMPRTNTFRTLIVEAESEPPVSQHPVPALPPALQSKLDDARMLRQVGAGDRLEPLLRELAAEAPHHPHVVLERVRFMLAHGDDAGVVQLGRAERLAQHDSVLVTRELAQAYEQLGRAREAAQVVAEHWLVLPTQADWAGAVMVRLLGADPRGVRDVMRRAAARLPDRIDLALGLARIEWRSGGVGDVLRAIGTLDGPEQPRQLRWGVAEEMLRVQSARDSSMAIDVLLDLVADRRHDAGVRAATARRVWQLYESAGTPEDGAQRLSRALEDLPPAQWNPEVLVGVARTLRESGRTAEARRLLDDRSLGAGPPQVALERALADLRDGPVERALPELERLASGSPEAAFRHAEALFYAGDADSAKAVYERIARDPTGAFTGASLERVFLIEEAEPREAVYVFGSIAYHDWRGDPAGATAMADSLYRALRPGPTWAQAGLVLSGLLERSGTYAEALAPLLAVAEQQPGDRLAPLARERAGDLYATRLGDADRAIAQYEEGLARYPRAWNAPEVRRKLEALRRERRF